MKKELRATFKCQLPLGSKTLDEMTILSNRKQNAISFVRRYACAICASVSLREFR